MLKDSVNKKLDETKGEFLSILNSLDRDNIFYIWKFKIRNTRISITGFTTGIVGLVAGVVITFLNFRVGILLIVLALFLLWLFLEKK